MFEEDELEEEGVVYKDTAADRAAAARGAVGGSMHVAIALPLRWLARKKHAPTRSVCQTLH